MKRSLLAGVAAVLLALAAVPSAHAEVPMKLASATINDVQHEWQKVFVDELEARAPGAFAAEIFPASQLGTIPRMAEGVLLGTIESFITPTAFLTGTDPRFQIFDAPGLFDGPEHLARVIHDPEYRDTLETLALDKGLRIIGAIYNSPMLMLSNDKVETLDGISGLKVHTFASPLQMEPMEALGASPLPLALSEVVPALQSGNIDAMLAGMPILVAFKYYDVAKHVLALEFQHIVSVAVVNEAWFQAQPAESQAAIREAGRAAETAVLEFGIANVGRANAAWTDNGGELTPLSEDDRDRMMELFGKVGAEVMARDTAVAGEFETLKALADAKR